MRYLKTIKYLLLLFISRLIKRKKKYSYPGDENGNIFYQFFSRLFGFIYYQFQKRKEGFRVSSFKLQLRIKEYKIVNEIVRLSGEIISLIIIFIVVSFAIDLLISKTSAWLIGLDQLQGFSNSLSFIRVPGRDFIELFLEISIGAISAVLGLLFALYAVGFQLSTDKYSSEVSDYVNEETVGSFYFKLLVFTDLLAISVLLRTEFFDYPEPIFSFAIACLMVVISLLGIIIFKSHYIVTIKPKHLFERLWSDIRDNIKTASDKSSYKYKSWSLVQHARNNTRKLLRLLENLFDDLLKIKNNSDAIYAPTVLAFVITEYAGNKKYIDRENGWWFYQKHDLAKSGSSSESIIKLNYELQGTGPLFLPKPDLSWFEDNAFTLFQKIQSHAINSNPDLLSHVIKSYQTILSGDYSKTNSGQKKIYGIYENQEIETYDKFFRSFLDLYKNITKQEDLNDYLNAYFTTGLVLIDGFKYKKYKEIIRSLVGNDGKLSNGQGFVENIDLPSIFYEQFIDYWKRLELEQGCEGKIMTPVKNLEEEMLGSVKSREKELFKKFFSEMLHHQEDVIIDLIKKKDYENCAHFIKIRFEWISRMFYLNKFTLANEFSQDISKCAAYILTIPKEILIKLELLEEIEKIIFQSILKKRKALFVELSKILSLIISVLNVNETNTDMFILRNRLVVILGGFLFLHSELEQNKKMLIEYVKIFEKSYRPGYFIKSIEILGDARNIGGIDLTTKLIQWETTKYHNWYTQIHHKILEMPKTYDHVRFYSGMQEVANHPSKFIREVSYGLGNIEDDSVEKFVEFIKRREEVLSFVTVLSKINETKK
ncbi:MAG TPA: DUF2254 family protein [Candidatus Moranbacteria bacterium]|jgi:hypothetical protein|nr:DUF2254 family protein [Candidatus Moranbacteria bacterium]